MTVFESIDRWLRPYRYHFEDEKLIEFKEQQKRKKKNIKQKSKRKLSTEEQKKTKEFLLRGGLGVELTTVNNVLNEESALRMLLRSSHNIGFFYHDDNYHQLAIKFKENSSWKYKERNEGKRKKLKPLVYHKNPKTQDKTHMIPIGFHGSEDDARLLIGFSAKINKGDLKNFEDYVAKINDNEEILWFVNIQKQSDNTVVWQATVWDVHNKIIAEETFHDKADFEWL